MKTKNVKINCPNCKTVLSVDELLINQFEDSIKKDLQSEMRRREDELLEKREEHKTLSLELEKKQDDVDALIKESVKTQLLKREQTLKDTIRKEIQEEKTLQLEELEDELNKKSKQLIELNQVKSKMKRLSREYEEREAKIHLEKEQELSDRLASAKISMKEQIQMESFLKVKEREDIIQSLKNKLTDAQNRIEQGSMQLQGEAQELVLEELLRDAHTFDLIEEIKKGVNGADCIQTVKLQSGIEAGKIIYESKNTKSWSNNFIKKLKQDNLIAKADIMVIVTKTMPKETNEKYLLMDGVWVTTLDNVRDLSLLIRFGILKTYAVMITQEDKKDKMGLLYNYLTSEEFKATFTSILDGFKSLQDSHHDEQRKMQLLWKRRAKHLEQVLSSTIDFYGSIKGISENSIPTIPMLEIRKAS